MVIVSAGPVAAHPTLNTARSREISKNNDFFISSSSEQCRREQCDLQ